MSKALTISDKLLLAAYSLSRQGKSQFTAEDLVVAAWQAFPDAFGMSGHLNPEGQPAYPDSNRVFAEIMGSKPLRRSGYIRKIGTKMYEITELGIDKARFLSKTEIEHSSTKSSLSREIEAELKRLFDSRAVEKLGQARAKDITFHDACTFWGISPRSSAIELEGRLQGVQETIERAEVAVGSGAISFEHGAQTFGSGDVEILRDVHKHLQGEFVEELSIIRTRTDERS